MRDFNVVALEGMDSDQRPFDYRNANAIQNSHHRFRASVLIQMCAFDDLLFNGAFSANGMDLRFSPSLSLLTESSPPEGQFYLVKFDPLHSGEMGVAVRGVGLVLLPVVLLINPNLAWWILTNHEVVHSNREGFVAHDLSNLCYSLETVRPMMSEYWQAI